jgi:hypothetical protein
MQILFVIDATKSMQPYFTSVQQAIREYKSSLPSSEHTKYHFAAAVYRDYADGEHAAELIANFDDEHALNRLSSVVAASNRADHDLPEAVFQGIATAIKSVRWNPESTQLVIVIGDHGNHPTEDQVAKYHLKLDLDEPESRGNTPESVANLLDPREGKAPYGRILFHAVNVNVRKDWLQYNDLFRDQMDAILDATKNGGRMNNSRHGVGSVTRLGVDDPSDHNRAKEQVKTAIAAAFASTNAEADLLNAKIDTGSCAKVPLSKDSELLLGTQACDFLMDKVKERGWTPPESGYSQICEEGWVLREKDNKDLLEPWVWMSRSELFTFTGFLSGVLTAGNHPERAKEVIGRTIESSTGDRMNGGESLTEYIKRVFHLPFHDETILRYTPEQLQDKLLNDKTFQLQYVKEIGRSLERLSLALAEQKADVPLTWDQSKGRWLKPAVEKIPTERRWNAQMGVELYGWFPLSYLPGGAE